MTAPTLDVARDVLDHLARAWNAGDATAYAGQFTETATYVTFDGRLLSGRPVIEEVHRFLFAGPLRGSRMVLDTGPARAVTTLEEGVAVLVGSGAVLLSGQTAGRTGAGDRGSVQTLVLSRGAERWRVAAFQNTRVAAER